MKTNRKGFTITELVIVIVVIAILAAVLIPTFASLIKKANQSADIQAARQMNTALAAESAVEKPESFQKVIEILEKAGYDAQGSLKPITKDHAFYWYSTYNVIVLANEAEGAEKVVVYPTNNDDVIDNFVADKAKTGDAKVLFDLEVGFRTYVRVDVTDAAVAADSLDKGQSLALTENITLETQPRIPAGAVTTLDMGGNTVSTTQVNGRSKYIEVSGTLILENGTFSGRGIQVNEGGKLIIKESANVTINAVDDNGGAAIWVYPGGEVVIDGGTYKATGGTQNLDDIVRQPGVINNSGKVTINGGTFTAQNTCNTAIISSGELIINNANVSAWRTAVDITGGTAVINGGSFKEGSSSSAHALRIGQGATVTLNGGAFTGDINNDKGTLIDKR